MIAPELVLSRVNALPALASTAVRLAELARDERSGAGTLDDIRELASPFVRPPGGTP